MTPDDIRRLDNYHIEAKNKLEREQVAIQAEIRDALLELVKQTKNPRSIFEQTFGR